MCLFPWARRRKGSSQGRRHRFRDVGLQLHLGKEETELDGLERVGFDECVRLFPERGYVTYGKLLSLYDGDTGDMAVMLPFSRSVYFRIRVRFSGYDAPEIRAQGYMGDVDRIRTIARAKEAKDRLFFLCGDRVWRVRCDGTDKYGRLLVTLYPRTFHDGECHAFETSVNAVMIREGHGVPYDGRHKRGKYFRNDDKLNLDPKTNPKLP